MSEGIDVKQIAEIRREITQINELLREAEPRLERSQSNLREQVRLLMASQALAKSVLGRENIPEGVKEDLRTLEILASELMYIRALYLQTMATLGPVGFGLIAIGALGSAVALTHRTRG